MSFLDQLLAGVKRIAIAGSLLPARPTVNFVSGVTGADNPATNSTDLTAGGGGGFGGLSGDVAVSGGSPVAAVVQSVTGGNAIASSGGGNALPIFGTDTRLNSGQPHLVHSFTASLNTTDDATHHLAFFDCSAFGSGTCVADFSVSFVAFHPASADFFRCDLTFTVVGNGGAFTVTPTTPTPQNTRSSGGGSGCNAEIANGSGNIDFRVTGVFGETFRWSCIGQVQVRV